MKHNSFFYQIRVGFIIDPVIPAFYNNAMASIRTRCYDIIAAMREREIYAELFRPWKDYDVIILTKTYSDRCFKVAQELKCRGVRVISDVYCEFYNDYSRNEEWSRLLSLVELSDAIIVASNEQRKIFGKYKEKCIYIPEGIKKDLLCIKKQHDNVKKPSLLWCGYSAKARDLYEIDNLLSVCIDLGICNLIIISEKDPKLERYNYRFIKYNQKNIGRLLCEGDIFIAPRHIADDDNRQHSFLRISMPMAVGLPVIASPVPSYYETPAIICNTTQEWNENIKILCRSVADREEIGKKGQEFVVNKASIDVTCDMYIDLIKEVLGGR